jgi:cytochrome c
MRRNFVKLSLVVSISAFALLTACGPKAPETAEAPAATPPAAEAPAAEATAAPTNAVAEAPAAAPTNAVAEAPAPAAAAPAAGAAAAPAAGAMVLAVKDASGADLSGDPTKGAATFRQCQTCHVKEIGVNKVGPSLAGIVGRAAGSVPGFNYSAANKGSGITWSEQELYVYLENPKAKIPGTTMAFVGIKDSQKRADLIAYLKTPS